MNCIVDSFSFLPYAFSYPSTISETHFLCSFIHLINIITTILVLEVNNVFKLSWISDKFDFLQKGRATPQIIVRPVYESTAKYHFNNPKGRRHICESTAKYHLNYPKGRLHICKSTANNILITPKVGNISASQLQNNILITPNVGRRHIFESTAKYHFKNSKGRRSIYLKFKNYLQQINSLIHFHSHRS